MRKGGLFYFPEKSYEGLKFNVINVDRCQISRKKALRNPWMAPWQYTYT